MKTNPKYFDQRTVRRNIELGFIKKDDHDQFIKSLPDETGNYDEVRIEDLDPEPVIAAAEDVVEDDENLDSVPESDENSSPL